MSQDRRLAIVSLAQLVAGVLGMAIAVRRRHHYDFLFMHGRPERVARDTVLMGTAFSAPVTISPHRRWRPFVCGADRAALRVSSSRCSASRWSLATWVRNSSGDD
jgi:hypothetical protein